MELLMLVNLTFEITFYVLASVALIKYLFVQSYEHRRPTQKRRGR